ncbi:MAG: nickel-type superoxide dismutase maturation protease [Candidatus Terrybacteria bacterium RIFCSPLOWO2_01_FULL_58_14]|uniref:Nickel-type superoxide dismutase maturation protease n=2 Tax=Candidatus Terryibacteriota TaxID=1817920 RepID=A0A1G2PVW7_9BACT|nr:MAG: nickel-type superoxide dismutase maturation protease [Candidatus Terrybacteria bacterium RIFCSPHIGHO2_01_FULL_58_15]OHA52443.1 MAG: nickel-type superoxide dismutase maturation protease [Candidatus Terrybacteria bacterium RIFCSPLOWO2_01_FULL_58_14]
MLRRFRVEGHSMEPCFRWGDRVLVERWSFTKRWPREGEVVAVRHPFRRERVLIKRVACVWEDGQCFVIGENPSDSHDSRHFGAVQREDVIGRVWFRY